MNSSEGKFTFKREDFKEFPSEMGLFSSPIDIAQRMAARIANKKLEEWLDKAPVVYTYIEDKGVDAQFGDWNIIRDDDCTHKAKLVMIEELKPDTSPCSI